MVFLLLCSTFNAAINSLGKREGEREREREREREKERELFAQPELSFDDTSM